MTAFLMTISPFSYEQVLNHVKGPAESRSPGLAYSCPSWWAGATPGCPVSLSQQAPGHWASWG